MGMLDTISGATCAFSMRKLRSAYSGNCLKVRRSSDNTTQDIGFSGGWLDESALTTFVGANDGFIDTWYDQTANGFNAIQATTTLQPRIVSSGTIYKPTPTRSGATARPSLAFGFSGTRYLEASPGQTSQASGFISTIGLRAGAPASGFGCYGISCASYSSLTGGFLLSANDGTIASSYAIWTDRGNVPNYPLTQSSLCQLAVALGGGTAYFSAKNGAILQAGTWSAYTFSAAKFIIGAWNGSALNGAVSESVFWLANKNSVQSDITYSQCIDFGIDIPQTTSGGGGTAGFTGLSGVGRLGT
jgi:hypothetical protein